jgi:NHLM bacteriocin system ABC transporter ATP-binding protein
VQANSLGSRFGFGEDIPITIGNHTPITLDDPQAIWLVYSGSADVFVRQMEGEEASGPRMHLLRAEAGQALFGIDLENYYGENIRIFMVGNGSTVVARLARSRFEELLSDPDYSLEAIHLLDSWIQNFAACIEDSSALRQFVLMEPGQLVDLRPGEVAHPRKGVVWARGVQGATHFLSKPELPLITEDDFLPITDETWLHARQEATLLALDTETFVKNHFSWTYIDNFHRVVLNSIVWHRQQVYDTEIDRLRRRAQYDRRRMADAFESLAATLRGTIPPARSAELAVDDPLLIACKLIGEALDVAIRAPHDPVDERRTPVSLETITRASGLRARKVLLRDQWWTVDSGPLLAYVAEDERPVALIPQGPGRYELRDPASQTREAVTPRVAATLSPAAYSLYRTLPARALSLSDLLRFGFAGAGNDLLLVLLMGIAAGLLGIAVPLVTGRIIDVIIPFADVPQLAQLAAILLVAAVVIALFQIVQTFAALRLEIKFDNSLQAAMWDRLLRLPVPFFRRYSAGDLGMRVMGINTIRRALSDTLVRTLLSSVFSVFNFALLFYFDRSLALIATALVLLPAVISALMAYTQIHYQRQHADLQGRISSMVLQFISGIAKLRVAGVEGRAFALWARRFAEQKRPAFQIGSIENALLTFNALYPVAASIVIFFFVARSPDLSTGEFLAFNAAFVLFLFAGLEVGAAINAATDIVPTYERMKPILQTLPEIDETRSDPGELAGEIEVSRVSFRYEVDSPLVLLDVSFHIAPGDFVALVGPSGSGKSTLLRLLLGFERPESGAIFYDGQNLSGLDLYGVRQQIGVVLQNSQLMTGDIFTNITGVAPLTMEDAWEAAHMAGLEDDLKQMPMGMHTIVSEGGSTLSGGQRQRLLIARAIAKKPKILIFDEATSALDNRTQHHVSQSLEQLEATRIVIAHRLSTIIHADRILVFDQGRIVETGTYAQLIKGDGLFTRLAQRQLI